MKRKLKIIFRACFTHVYCVLNDQDILSKFYLYLLCIYLLINKVCMEIFLSAWITTATSSCKLCYLSIRFKCHARLMNKRIKKKSIHSKLVKIILHNHQQFFCVANKLQKQLLHLQIICPFFLFQNLKCTYIPGPIYIYGQILTSSEFAF